MGILLPIGNQNYGFTDAGPADRRYAVTGDYMTIARNHCAATMLTNAIMLLAPDDPLSHDPQALFREIHAAVGNGPILHLQNKTNRYLATARLPYTCRQIDRSLTESSPERLVTMAQEALRGEAFEYDRHAERPVQNPSQQGSVTGHPVGLLVAASPLCWHWVLALPESLARPDLSTSTPRSAASINGCADAFTILDNWHPNRLYHYTPDQGARLMAVCVFISSFQ